MTQSAPPLVSRNVLEGLYWKYNRREYVHPDPLEFLYAYEDVRDREIAGLVASSLAYGRVKQILRSVAAVLERMRRPSQYLRTSTARRIADDFAGFKHRFTTGEELAGMLIGAGKAVEEYGSLEALFQAGLAASGGQITGALEFFAARVNVDCGSDRTSLIPDVSAGSACKRLNLYLRWMVRQDEVDPGGWVAVGRERLLVPLDTHMYSICAKLAMTSRRQADAKAVMQITEAFRRIAPEDPVKYDFALTRLGIREDSDKEELYCACGLGKGA